MNQNLLEERKIISSCYDHLGGILGEALFNFFIKEKWIQKDEKEISITENGWDELEILGLDIEKLCSTKRKVVTICIERYYGIFHEHTGGYLGTLLADWLVDSGWIVKKVEDNFSLTKKGLYGLESLGVDIKCFKELI